MRSIRWVGFGVIAAVVACAGLLLGSASADKAVKKKGKKRAASTHQLMEGLVAPNCGALAKALKSDNPNWKKISLHAAMLNEGGFCLMDDSRCPSAEWAKGAKTVQKCSKVVLAKAKAKDIAGARSAFKALTSGGCAVCHKKHRHKHKK